MFRIIVLVLLCIFPFRSYSLVINGVVLDYDTKKLLQSVSVTASISKRGAKPDGYGRFQIEVGPTTRILTVSCVGYRRIDYVIDFDKASQEILLHIDKKEIDEVVIMGRISSPTSKVSMTDLEIRRIPVVFGEADVVKALQLQPGVSPGIEGFAGFNVHGGEDDQNLFIIDGHPVYTIGHLGGLFSSFNVEATSNLDFYKSSFPARYGGRVSSVVDIKTKDCSFDNYSGSLMLGLTSGSLYLSGPISKNKLAFALSVRRSWLDLLSRPVLSIYNAKSSHNPKNDGSYSFMDVNGKITYCLGRMGAISASVYFATDRLTLREWEKSINKTDCSLMYDKSRLHWGNLISSIDWKHKAAEDKLSLHFSLYNTHYSSWMKREIEHSQWYQNDDEIQKDSLFRIEKNAIDDVALSGDLCYTIYDNMIMRAGLFYTMHHYRPMQILYGNETNTIGNSSVIKANEFGAYIEDELILKQLSLNIGLRIAALYQNNSKYHAIEPRFSALYSVSPTIGIQFGYSRMCQFSQRVNDSYVNLPTDFWIPSTSIFKPLTSDQLTLGANLNLAKGWQLSTEFFYKWMRQLVEYKEGYQYMPHATAWEDKLTSGKGNAYGVDIMMKKTMGNITGMVGYGLLWSKRQFPELNGGHDFPAKYDNRHKLNLFVTSKLRTNVELNAAWTFMSGNRLTVAFENYQDLLSAGFNSDVAPINPYREEIGLDYYNFRNNVRMPAYHRLDVGLNFYRPKSNGRMGIWNVSVYNAYCRMNPISIEKNTDVQTMDGKRLKPRFRTLALFPIIPSISYTYKF